MERSSTNLHHAFPPSHLRIQEKRFLPFCLLDSGVCLTLYIAGIMLTNVLTFPFPRVEGESFSIFTKRPSSPFSPFLQKGVGLPAFSRSGGFSTHLPSKPKLVGSFYFQTSLSAHPIQISYSMKESLSSSCARSPLLLCNGLYT